MPNGINDISPGLRDWLLNRNLILSDTIEDNNLQGLATGLGRIAQTETLPTSVQQLDGVVEGGNVYRDLNLIYNPYKSSGPNEEIDITSTNSGVIGNLPPGTSPTEYTNAVGSNNENSSFNIESDKAREQMLKNKYYDSDELYKVNINTTSIPSDSDGVYKFRTSLLSRGVDFLANSVGLGGASQTLGTVVDNNDREMGRIANNELLKHFGYNAAFNTSKNTLGKIDLSPINGISGGDLLNIDFTITVPKGGKAGDYMGKVLGTELPIDKTGPENSIFTDENPVTNTDRLNSQVENLGKGQVDTLKKHFKYNKYKPTVGKPEDEDALQGELYAFDNGEGGIDNLTIGRSKRAEGEEIPEEEEFEDLHGRITSQIKNDSIKGFGDNLQKRVKNVGPDMTHHWTDNEYNKEGVDVFKTEFNSKKSLLNKTNALFKSGKMKTLTTGKGNLAVDGGTEVETSVNEGYISKGSGVIKGDVLLPKDGEETSVSSADDIFCRTWTTFDRYDKVSSLQKNSKIKSKSRGKSRRNTENSVLDDNGFVRIGPQSGDGDDVDSMSDTKIKRFMFSLENLAWSDSDSLAFLPNCEKGPGDPMTGTRGRIMWFPPYGINFTDNASVNLDSTNFIGRGEPIYTYNNTERIGTLQWKIIMDHASYMNDLKGESLATNDIFASIASGCLDSNAEIRDKMSPIDIDKYERLNARENPEVEDTPGELPDDYSVYFPNDNTSVLDGYEDGSGSGIGNYTASAGYVTEDALGSNYKTRKYQDTTNYGLNETWSGAFLPELAERIVEEIPYTKIIIKGYASKDGEDKHPDANVRLSNQRAKNVATELKALLRRFNDPLVDKRFKSVQGEGSSGKPKATYDTPDGTYSPGAKCTSNCIDSKGKKEDRKVTVSFEYDSTLKEEVTNSEKPVEKNDDLDVSSDVKKKFFTECMYFEKLGKEDSTVINKISEKIKYFHPAYHSVTPEGFNSRLTFLQQCTRQGPTLGREGSPNNLAFGKPPVCILRIGDFYHTKIMVDTIDFSYDTMTWDINPEGVGVQPMICDVNMTFKIIGGSSIQGPINKLQNAVSFNYYANTEIYDDRANYFKKSSGVDPETGKPNENPYELVNGVNPNNFDTPESAYKKSDSDKSGINNNKEVETDDEGRAEKINKEQ